MLQYRMCLQLIFLLQKMAANNHEYICDSFLMHQHTVSNAKDKGAFFEQLEIHILMPNGKRSFDTVSH